MTGGTTAVVATEIVTGAAVVAVTTGAAMAEAMGAAMAKAMGGPATGAVMAARPTMTGIHLPVDPVALVGAAAPQVTSVASRVVTGAADAMAAVRPVPAA